MLKSFHTLLAIALFTYAGAIYAKSAPAAPGPAALRDWHRRELRVAAIAQSILAANLATCPKQSLQYGLVVARLDEASPPAVRTALTEALGLRDTPTAMAVVPGSPAEKAGLREGDHITAINNTPWPVTDTPPSGARKAFWDALGSGQQASAMQVEIERGGQLVSLRLTGQPACTAGVFLINRKAVNATTFGARVEVHSGLEAVMQNNAELAFIISHEIAHVILEHSGPGKEAQIKDRTVRSRIEVEADAMGVLLMARAGYDPDAAALANMRMDQNKGPITRLLGLHGSYMSSAERGAYLTRRASEVRAQLASEAGSR